MKYQSDHAYSSTLCPRKTAVVLFSIARIAVITQGGAYKIKKIPGPNDEVRFLHRYDIGVIA